MSSLGLHERPIVWDSISEVHGRIPEIPYLLGSVTETKSSCLTTGCTLGLLPGFR
jgi:hypothetical protein